MDDATFEAQKQRVMNLANWWQPKLALNQWEIVHYFPRSGDEMPDANDNRDALALCRPKWSYLIASIYWNVGELEGVADDVLERIFVHELMHVHLSEMKAAGDDHEERVATELALSFVWLRNDVRQVAGVSHADD